MRVIEPHAGTKHIFRDSGIWEGRSWNSDQNLGVCNVFFQTNKLNISQELLALKNIIFLAVPCPKVLFLRVHNLLGRDECNTEKQKDTAPAPESGGRQPREVALGRCGSYHVIIISLENHRSELYLLPHNALGCDYLMITILKISFFFCSINTYFHENQLSR